MSDYQSQLTAIYNKLGGIQSSLGKLALLSRVNTMQDILQNNLNSLMLRLDSAEESLNQMKLTMNDIITEMRDL